MIARSIQLDNGQNLNDIANLIQSKRSSWKVTPKGKFLKVDKNGKSFLLRTQNSHLKASITAPLWINILAIVPAIFAINLLFPHSGFLIRFLLTFVSMFVSLIIATTLYSNSNADEINQFYDELDKIVKVEA